MKINKKEPSDLDSSHPYIINLTSHTLSHNRTDTEWEHHMYGRLTNAKLFGGFSHSCVRVNNEVCYFHGPLFDIGLQGWPSLFVRLAYIYEGRGGVRTNFGGHML